MVSPPGTGSKHFHEKLLELDSKLEQLGLVEIDGKIVYLDEEVSNV